MSVTPPRAGKRHYKADSVSTTSVRGGIWILDFDAGSITNGFSVKLNDKDGNWLPLANDPVFLEYGTGPIGLSGTGLSSPVRPGFCSSP